MVNSACWLEVTSAPQAHAVAGQRKRSAAKRQPSLRIADVTSFHGRSVHRTPLREGDDGHYRIRGTLWGSVRSLELDDFAALDRDATIHAGSEIMIVGGNQGSKP